MAKSTMELYVNGVPYQDEQPIVPTAFWKKRSVSMQHINSSGSCVPLITPPSTAEIDEAYSRLEIEEGSDVDTEAPLAAKKLLAAMAIRERYAALNPRQLLWAFDGKSAFDVSDLPAATEHTYQIVNGVFQWKQTKDEQWKSSVPTVLDFLRDYQTLLDISANGPVKTLSYKRLKVLSLKYDLHVLLNGTREQMASQNDPRDFSNVTKVDTHIHLSAAMTSKHLLDYIRDKLHNAGSDVVMKKNGIESTLEEVFNKIGIPIDAFTLNRLDTRADNTFQRFDHFNAKYNPFGKSELREVFLKSNNYMGGLYYAEITKQLFTILEKSKYVCAEYRVSIYGSSPNEWDELAKWVINNKLYSDKQRWLIQIPRIFNVFRKTGATPNFEQLLANIFGPLFEVTVNPSSHPELHAFLNQVSGFDSVDDESKPERKFDDIISATLPQLWTSEENPPYAYYSYYFWANIVSLNQLRLSKGLKTFDFRPHCGESGDPDHLSSSYILATNISHGINLDKNIPLQYLYFLSQVGIAVSPLSNNSLFLEYALNPFPKFFKRGLNVSLSSDDPLQFHYTEQPLIEEYATAAQKWELRDGDLCEVARNSILQSGFEHSKKKKWLGENYLEPGVKGNNIAFSNVPDIRIAFREDNLVQEKAFLENSAKIDLSKVVVLKDIPEHTSKITLSQSYFDESEQEACAAVKAAVEAKKKYALPTLTPQEASMPSISEPTPHVFRLHNGVIHVYEGAIVNGKQFIATEPMVTNLISYAEFEKDVSQTLQTMKKANVLAFASSRLKLMDNKFGFHTLLNGSLEKDLMREFPTDYAHVTKVDNHVRLQNSMIAKHFIKFVKNKLKNHASDVVVTSNGRKATLGSLYAAIDIPIDNLTVDTLYLKADSGLEHMDAAHVTAPTSTDLSTNALWHLYSIFLQTDNDINGLYFAELAKEVMRKREKTPQILHEYRLFHYARNQHEWDHLANWIVTHQVSSPHVQWLIELPQSYWHLKKNDKVESFQTILDNIFLPLLEVTRDPSSHPELALVLPKISGFYVPPSSQLVAESSKIDPLAPPSAWDKEEQPPLSYALYHLWANMYTLNSFRKTKNLHTLSLRVSCNSSTHSIEKAALWMLSNGIHNADVVLRSSPVLTYLTYLSQTHISICPLAGNTRAHHYSDSLFMSFFRQGLNVSLSSDNPLQLHMTNEPLSEEYAIASHMWKLSNCDLSEIARNSVLMSGFSHFEKANRIGEHYYLPGTKGNSPTKTDIPNIRIAFREKTLREEFQYISNGMKSRSASNADLQAYLSAF